MFSKKAIHPAKISKARGVYSAAISVSNPGKLVFLSGFTSRNEKGEVVHASDIRGQTRQVCENLKATIEAAGGSLSDLVSVTVFVRDVKDFHAIHEVRKEYFPTDPPASTMVEVTSLVHKDCLIEINAIGALP